ncbi:unnamed protein product [Ilex paraguariensis]|uniref:Gnk2-homologous domain-containing protein n=1 Tax=Ilex paraguariensis TaxID=185542 RepID=A0ABC8SXV8_9AQUA
MLLLKDPKSYILFVMISINGFGQIFCVHAQALSYLCSDDIANSSYIDDRTSLLDSLSSRATSMDFYNETFNDIHGLFLCRGNVNASTCRNCVTGAGEEIIKVCLWRICTLQIVYLCLMEIRLPPPPPPPSTPAPPTDQVYCRKWRIEEHNKNSSHHSINNSRCSRVAVWIFVVTVWIFTKELSPVL